MRMKRIFAGACAGLMAMTMVAPAFADSTAATIDTTKTGSITLYKLRENDKAGATEEGYGKTGEENGRAGMANVKFQGKKIADVKNLSGQDQGGNAVVGVYYVNVDAAFITAVNKVMGAGYMQSKAQTIDGQQCFTSEAMTEIMAAVRASAGDTTTYTGETELRDVALGGTVNFAKTDTSGRTTVSSLPLGLYLIAEDEANSTYTSPNNEDSEAIANPASPFLVSVPMTEYDEHNSNAGKIWQYDIVAYPKNTVVTTQKFIISQDDKDTLLESEDWQVGDIIKQVILADAPIAPNVSDVRADKNYTKFEIEDTMDAGLKFLKVTKVTYGAKTYNVTPTSAAQLPETAFAATDYTVAATANGFKVTLTAAGLAKLNAQTVDSQVNVYFDSCFTQSMDIVTSSTEVNANHPKLTWQNNNTLEKSTEGNPVYNYAYELDLTKTGVDDFSAVSFEVTRQGESNKMSFVKESDGVYHPVTYTAVDTLETPVVTAVVPDSTGKLVIRGFDDTTYTFKEISTEDHHNLLKTTFSVTFTGADPATGRLARAVVTTDGGQSTELAINKSGTNNTGIANVTVDNTDAIVLRTGGQGTMMIYVSAFAILALAGAAYVVSRKRSIA